MGYTHYWSRVKELEASRFAIAVADCRKVCEALPFPLGNYFGVEQPIFTDSEIGFNGSTNSHQFASLTESIRWSHNANTEMLISDREAGKNGDGSYETFAVSRMVDQYDVDDGEPGWYFGCCKTAHRPYDLNVQACLVILNYRLGDEQFRVSSDGDESDWNTVREVCEAVLGYGMHFRFTRTA